MKKFSWQEGMDDEELNIDVTPMLDVVFILLIFFIVTASFVKEAGIDVNRPQASTATQQENASIQVALTNDDSIWIDGRKIEQHALRANIERLHAENPKGSVVIQADKDSRNELLIAVMDSARAVGVSNVAIATADGE